jgi:hypothetical protein
LIFYGLATWECQSVEDFFLSREEAEACLERVLRDEPEWRDSVGLVRLDFYGPEPTIERLPDKSSIRPPA